MDFPGSGRVYKNLCLLLKAFGDLSLSFLSDFLFEQIDFKFLNIHIVKDKKHRAMQHAVACVYKLSLQFPKYMR